MTRTADPATGRPRRRVPRSGVVAFGGVGRFVRSVSLVAAVVVPALLVTLWMNAASGQQPLGDGPEPAFFNYESGPVRPIALTPDGRHLVVANTPAA